MKRTPLVPILVTVCLSTLLVITIGLSHAAAAADTTKPTTTITLTPGAPNGTNSWYQTAVTVLVTATDNVGVAETRCALLSSTATAPLNFDALPVGCAYSGAGAQVTVDGLYKFYAASRDPAGNKEAVKLKTFNIDKTPPTVVSSTPSRAANAFGWYTALLSWAFAGTDATSGIASCPSVSYSGPDSEGATVSGTCTDKAGNRSAPVSSAVFKYDATGPVGVALSVTAGTPGTNGWYTSNVTVQADGADPVSGIASCTTTNVTADTAGRNITGSCRNGAGLTTNAAPLTVKLDKTPPAISVSVSPDSLWPPNHQMVDIAATVNVTDKTSGSGGFLLRSVISSDPDDGVGDGDTAVDIMGFDIDTPDTSGLLRAERAGHGGGRIYTLTYHATDLAGNAARTSATVDVTHDPARPRKSAVGLGVDRVLELQRTEPGWEGTWYWYVGHTANVTNLTGTTALGLLEAYRDTRDTATLDAVKAAAAFVMTHLGSGATGVRYFQRMTAGDIIMLHELTDITGDATYATRATAEWNNIKTFWPTAAVLDSVFRSTNRRLGAWDMAFYLEAATLSGDPVWANDAAVILADVRDAFYYGVDNPYYPYTVPGALRALAGRGYAETYQAEVTTLLNMLFDMISDDNVAGGIQATAYAVMALQTVGGQAHSYANAMAKWLAARQTRYGGWLDGGVEYAQVDGEAVRAIAATMGADLALPGFAPHQANSGGWRPLASRRRAIAFDAR